MVIENNYIVNEFIYIEYGLFVIINGEEFKNCF